MSSSPEIPVVTSKQARKPVETHVPSNAMEAPQVDKKGEPLPATVIGRAESALSVLSGDRYHATMQGAQRERDSLIAEVRKSQETEFQRWAQDLTKHPETKMFGEMYLHPEGRKALEALETHDMPAAETAFRALLKDPEADKDVKMFAANTMMAVCVEKGDLEGMLDFMQDFLGSLPTGTDAKDWDLSAWKSGVKQFKDAMGQGANLAKLDEALGKLEFKDGGLTRQQMKDAILKMAGRKSESPAPAPAPEPAPGADGSP